MSKQDEFIKQLYYGDDLFYENTRKDSSKKCELNKIRDEIHEKIMQALIQVYGEEEANKINEEWIGCSSEIEISSVTRHGRNSPYNRSPVPAQNRPFQDRRNTAHRHPAVPAGCEVPRPNIPRHDVRRSGTQCRYFR